MFLKFPISYSFQQFFYFLPIIPKIILDKYQPSTLNLLNLHIYPSYKEHNIIIIISYLNMKQSPLQYMLSWTQEFFDCGFKITQV